MSLEYAKEVLSTEAKAINRLADLLDGSFLALDGAYQRAAISSNRSYDRAYSCVTMIALFWARSGEGQLPRGAKGPCVGYDVT